MQTHAFINAEKIIAFFSRQAKTELKATEEGKLSSALAGNVCYSGSLTNQISVGGVEAVGL